MSKQLWFGNEAAQPVIWLRDVVGRSASESVEDKDLELALCFKQM